MATLTWEVRIPLPVDEAPQPCISGLEWAEMVIESVDQNRIAAKQDWRRMMGDANVTSFGRVYIDILLAPVGDSETLVTLNARMKGLGQPAKVQLRNMCMAVAGAIDRAAQQTAHSGPAGESKAASDHALTAGLTDQSGTDRDVFDAIAKLGELHGAGVLTDEEFQAKKSELLGRL